MRALMTWFSKYGILVQFVIVILLVILPFMPNELFPYEQALLAAITGLSTELFLMTFFVYTKFDEQNRFLKYSPFCFLKSVDYEIVFESAKKDIYICGVGNTMLINQRDNLIHAMNRGVDVYILYAAESDKVGVYDYFRESREGKPLDYSALQGQSMQMIEIMRDVIKDKSKLHVKRAKGVLGTMYFGIDIDENYGLIKLDPILQGLPSHYRPHIRIKYSDDPTWYNVYKKYIHDVWSDSLPAKSVTLD